jgi:hypothetical protein
VPGFPQVSPRAHPYYKRTGEAQPAGDEAPHAGGEDLPQPRGVPADVQISSPSPVEYFPEVAASLRLKVVARRRSPVRIVRLVVYVLEVVALGEFLDVSADYAELGEGVGGDNSAVRAC